MFRIAGAGCSLMDYLYTGIDFGSREFSRYRSLSPGDGGLEPGKLVFVEELERFAGKPFRTILLDIAGGREPDSKNLGGPAVVALIHAAQMLEGSGTDVSFHGFRGADEDGAALMDILNRTPVRTDGYLATEGGTPFTYVFSDPTFAGGHGERTFVNSIGAAGAYGPEDVHPDLYGADIVLFGGTALVPRLHDGLAGVLSTARDLGCVTVVNTVYDFRNQKRDPLAPWPLGESLDTYRSIDLLIVDCEEGLRLSGQRDIMKAAEFFLVQGVGACMITHGAEDTWIFSSGDLFRRQDLVAMPVSRAVQEDIAEGTLPKGDTTGCGDNFVGGAVASLALQLQRMPKGELDLVEACAWATVSGGFACFCTGGTQLEDRPGEKREAIERYYAKYRAQL